MADWDRLRAIVQELSPDYIVYTAADMHRGVHWETVRDKLWVGVDLPTLLMQAALEEGVIGFVGITTYSTSVNGTSYSPQTFYAASKKAMEVMGEYYHLRSDLQVCFPALYDLYGPHQSRPTFLEACLEAIRLQQPLHMSPGEQDICFLHVADAASAVQHILDTWSLGKGFPDMRYCVHGNEVFTLKDVPQIVASALGKACPPVIHDMPYRPAEIMRFAPPYEKLPRWEAIRDLAPSLQDPAFQQPG